VLHERLGCELQIGGSDQWGNITAGIDLIRRHRGAAVHGLTWPLVSRADGRAFRKSEGGETPWLAAARTSPYRFFQFWIQTDDRDVDRYLRIFTFLDLEEIEAAVTRGVETPERREGQRLLARTVTSMVHGAEAAAAAEEASAVLFGATLDGVSARALATLAGEVPSHSVARHLLDDGVELVELLMDAGLVTSRSAASRLIEGGGVYVNDRREAQPRTLRSDDLLHGRYVLLRKGKRDYFLVEAV
jgi:tyrosyl-tRNA synthetase